MTEHHFSEEIEAEASEIQGIVIAVQANFYQVKLKPDSLKQQAQEFSSTVPTLLCTRRILLKKIGQKVMVGDQVIVEEVDWIEGRGVISHVFPRKTELDRPPVANADQILLVFAVDEPPLDPWQLSRFLVKAESTGLELCLCLNKCDLISISQQKEWDQRLQSWGYQPSFISVEKNEGLAQLLDRLNHKITIVAGPSGVGKSSLINHLIPHLHLRVNAVSGKLHRGRHTTRHVELFELPVTGLLADTPGFNQPFLTCKPTELIDYFPEVKAKLQGQNCQFHNCLHRDEPNCVVRGEWERYEYYLKFLDEVTNFQEKILHSADEDESFKIKITESGKKEYEPRLESKKYRRGSRRKKHQKLQEFYEEIDDENF
jgi:ribosome biogenesis GTPase / thiamine phosphate phosphatase